MDVKVAFASGALFLLAAAASCEFVAPLTVVEAGTDANIDAGIDAADADAEAGSFCQRAGFHDLCEDFDEPLDAQTWPSIVIDGGAWLDANGALTAAIGPGSAFGIAEITSRDFGFGGLPSGCVITFDVLSATTTGDADIALLTFDIVGQANVSLEFGQTLSFLVATGAPASLPTLPPNTTTHVVLQMGWPNGTSNDHYAQMTYSGDVNATADAGLFTATLGTGATAHLVIGIEALEANAVASQVVIDNVTLTFQ